MKVNSSHGAKVMTALLSPMPEKREEFLQTLRHLVTEIRKEPGCMECVLGQEQEADRGGRFLLFMVWKDHQALKTHLDSEHSRILHGAASVLSLPSDFRVVFADSAFVQPPAFSRSVTPPSNGGHRPAEPGR